MMHHAGGCAGTATAARTCLALLLLSSGWRGWGGRWGLGWMRQLLPGVEISWNEVGQGESTAVICLHVCVCLCGASV